MSAPYSSILLNELHTHFPDLLYRRARFQTVAHVLDYIVEIANQNPYQRSLVSYLEEEKKEERIPVVIPFSAPRVQRISIAPQPPLDDAVDLLYREMYGESLNVRNTGISNHLSSFLNQLSPINMQSFLEPVIVRPTNEQIVNASTMFRAGSYEEDELPRVCPICQDSIETTQVIRRLNHCSHQFHKDCIDTWFQTHVTCPTCRHDIRDQ